VSCSDHNGDASFSIALKDTNSRHSLAFFIFLECVIALRLRKTDSQLEDALCSFKPHFHCMMLVCADRY